MMNKKNNLGDKRYEMIGKCLYFPTEKILVIGDLHLGYGVMLNEIGVEFPMQQIEETINELERVFNYLKKENKKFEKIIMLGDLKHYFKFLKKEKIDILKLVEFLKKHVKKENLIFIKGNHDKFDLGEVKFRESYVFKNIAFAHGDKKLDVFDKKGVGLIVMGHEHPTIIIKDKKGVKKEKYKCFLIGKLYGKDCVVVPSFLNITLGLDVLEREIHESIFSKKEKGFMEVFVVNDNLNERALNFGKLKDYNFHLPLI